MFYRRKIYFLENKHVEGTSTENILSIRNLRLLCDSASDKKCSINYKPFLGLFYTVLASLFLNLMTLFVKQLSYIDPAQLSQVRHTGEFFGSLPIAVYSVDNILGDKSDRLSLVIRGFVAGTASYFILSAFRYLPLTEAATVMSAMPAVITVMACVFLKEPFGLVQCFVLVVTIFGVLLSVHLPDLLQNNNSSRLDSNYIFGLISGLCCLLLLSTYYVALRRLKNVHSSVILLYGGFFGMLENCVINASTSHFVAPRCGWDEIRIMLIGIFAFLGQLLLTLAIQAEAVGIVSVVKASADIMVNMVFQIIIFHENPDALTIGGAFLVIVSVSTIGLSKWVTTLPEESKARKRLRYLLL